MNEKFYCNICEKNLSLKNIKRHEKSNYHIKRLKLKNGTFFEGGDIQKSLTQSKWIPKFLKTEYGELHLPGHNGHKFHSYLGPGSRLDIRLNNNDQPHEWSKPICKVDEAALKHDIKYRSENLEDRHVADVHMIHELNNANNLTTREKIERALVKLIMKGKILFGGGMGRIAKTKAIENLYKNPDDYEGTSYKEESSVQEPTEKQKQLANELHHEYKKPSKYLKVQIFGKDNTWGCDLADMVKKSSDDEKFRYILVCIDLYTRYGWAIPMIDKKQETLRESFEQIFENDQRIPDYIWFDKESAIKSKYFDKFLKENDIKLYHTENEGKSVFAERFIRTLKNKMWKYFTAVGNQKWNNALLQKIVNEYNNTVHSSIHVTPKEASEKPELVKEINEQHNHENDNLKEKIKFKIGDKVRIFKYKNKFEKGYETKWTKEIFIVDRIYYTKPITYSLRDLNGEKILGRMYGNEMQKSKF